MITEFSLAPTLLALDLSQISGVDGASGMTANFALRFGGTSMILNAIAAKPMRRFSGSVPVISYGKPNPLISKEQGNFPKVLIYVPNTEKAELRL
jgi:hypothetical protein